MCDTKATLKEHCKRIRNELIERAEDGFVTVNEDGDEEYYLDDNYNTDYIWRRGFGLMGVRLMVAAGGPTIWIDTYAEEVQGFWGGDVVKVPIPRDTCYAIDDYFEMYAAEDIANDVR